MSRTIRIKNNFLETTQDCWKPRSVKIEHDYGWVDYGDCLVKECFDYKTKREYWRASRYFHTDGKAWAISNGQPWEGAYRTFNRANRRKDKVAMSEFVKGSKVYDDVILPGHKTVPYHYF